MNPSKLSTISKFGKFFTKDEVINSQTQIVKLIQLKQNLSHQKPLTLCKFDMAGNKIYLIDSSGTLIGLNLIDNTISTLKDQKILHFTIDGNNPYHILLVNRKSQLFRLHFQSKKSIKIMNLNMSRVIAFQRNYLRQLLLVLDYKILMLYDLTNFNKNRSLKANHQQIFTNAAFASNNRFLILAVKNIQIRVLEIMNFNTLHKIRLPFQIEQLKIQISYDCKKISIYGKCHIIFFISFNQQLQLSYQLVQLPNIKAIKQLKYTYQGQIVFLANDQIIYAISPDSLNKLVPIFNMQQKIRLMGFDLTIDNKAMVIVSNRTVFSLNWKNGLKKVIKNSEIFKSIEIVQNLKQNKNNQLNQINSQNYQYDEQEQQQQYQNQFDKKQLLQLNSKGQNIINQKLASQTNQQQNFQNNKIELQSQENIKKNLIEQNKEEKLEDLILKQDRIRKQLMNLYTQKDRI